MDEEAVQLERIRQRNRLAKRRSRARQRQGQNSQCCTNTHKDSSVMLPSPASSDNTWSQQSDSESLFLEPSHIGPGSMPLNTIEMAPVPWEQSLDLDGPGRLLSMPTVDWRVQGGEGQGEGASDQGRVELRGAETCPGSVNWGATGPPSLLHIAVGNRSKGIAQTLLSAGGANVNANDAATGDRPLHRAVRARSKSISRMLIHHGASLESRNAAGMSPLDLAVRMQDEEMVKLLISEGACAT